MTHDEIRRHELSDFLRTRRARISPAGIGFPAANRRRTPGLRREGVVPPENLVRGDGVR